MIWDFSTGLISLRHRVSSRQCSTPAEHLQSHEPEDLRWGLSAHQGCMRGRRAIKPRTFFSPPLCFLSSLFYTSLPPSSLSPCIISSALLDANVRGREDSLGVLVSHGEASVPPGVLLQDMYHITKLQRQVGISQSWLIAVGDWTKGTEVRDSPRGFVVPK